MPSTQTRLISDRYKLIRPLGSGGMGVVWLAEDTLLTRSVAVKEVEFPPGLDSRAGEAVKARAVREARSAARLAHPGVVTIYDVIQVEQGAFIVMEFVDSPTLSQYVKDHGPLSPQRAAELGLQILDALEVAHANGVVHRDVKPGNIMLTPDDRVKLADFGIASVKDDPKITSTGMVLGSPQFMAPEQANGSGSDARTDFWALGATLYYIVEGNLPFDRGRPIPTLAAVVHDDPPEMLRAGPLEPIIRKLLAKAPEERPSGAELKAMLDNVARSSQSAPWTSVEDSEQTDPFVTQPRAPAARSRPPGRRRWSAPAALAILAAVAVIVTAAAWALRGQDSTPESNDRGGSTANEDGGGGIGAEQGGQDAPATSGAVPGKWEKYTDDTTGFRLRYPPGWDVSRDGTLTDFSDPETGTYLRVDWTGDPGSSPEAAWRSLADSFAAQHDDYSEIGITPMTFKGNDAALWEFAYSEGGASLHAADLGFVTEQYGFALYFQTREENWEASQDLFRRLQASFHVPK